MKRHLIAAFVLLAAVSCQEEILIEPSLVKEAKTFYAVTEGATKTSLDSDLSVLWTTGDLVAVFAKNNPRRRYQVEEGGNTSATLTKVTLGENNLEEFDDNIAYYPCNNCSGDVSKYGTGYKLEITLPQEQIYSSSSFGEDALPMVAVSSGDSFVFRNLCGALKLQLKGTSKVASIDVSGNNGEILAGSAVITAYKDAEPSFFSIGESDKYTSVKLVCEDGVQLNEDVATPFIVVLPPMTFSKGFTITITSTGGHVMNVSTSKSKTIVRSEILRMAEIEFVPTPEYVDLGLPSGTLWATTNIGADTEYDYGDYFAWGETETKTNYDWSTYKYGTEYAITKYCANSSYGTVDNRIILDGSDDAATALLGSEWRTPTQAEFEELLYGGYTTSYWVDYYDQQPIKGYLVTSSVAGHEDDYVFFPATGYRTGQSVVYTDSESHDIAYYWASNLADDRDPSSMQFSSGIVCSTALPVDKCLGMTIRPVRSNGNAGVTAISGGSTTRIEYGSSKTLSPTISHTSGSVDYGYVRWTSKDPDIASVDASGRVSAKKGVTTRITAETVFGHYSTIYPVMVINEPVDLGLSVKWCSENVNFYEDHRSISGFAWYDNPDETEYDNSSYSSYATACTYQSNGWRLPTLEEWQELMSSCEIVHGDYPWYDEFKSKITGNSIFLPASYIDTEDYVTAGAAYWSSTSSGTNYVYVFSFNLSLDDDGYWYDRIIGGRSLSSNACVRLVHD